MVDWFVTKTDFPKCPVGTPMLYGRPLAVPGLFAGSNNCPDTEDPETSSANPVGMPYLNSGMDPDPNAPDWRTFTNDEDTFSLKLCMYCGTRITGPAFLARYHTGPSSERNTSGTAAHPTCGLYATRSCPHLTDSRNQHPLTIVGWVIAAGDGTGIIPCQDSRGRMDFNETFCHATTVTDRAVPVTSTDLRALARAYPER